MTNVSIPLKPFVSKHCFGVFGSLYFQTSDVLIPNCDSDSGTDGWLDQETKPKMAALGFVRTRHKGHIARPRGGGERGGLAIGITACLVMPVSTPPSALD